MEPSDENITSLLGMGFEDIGQVRRALRLAKNDLSEAVSILTGEDNREGFIGPENVGDVEMKDTQYQPGDNELMPSLVEIGQEDKHKQPPPSYNEAVSTTVEDTDSNSENVDIPLDSVPDEFPTTNLYELQERIFTENWSIPYRKNESLGKCLLGATKVTLRGEQLYCLSLIYFLSAMLLKYLYCKMLHAHFSFYSSSIFKCVSCGSEA